MKQQKNRSMRDMSILFDMAIFSASGISAKVSSNQDRIIRFRLSIVSIRAFRSFTSMRPVLVKSSW
eukprot:scaffold39122_cov109-Skeletonema_marinoi.AAC.4